MRKVEDVLTNIRYGWELRIAGSIIGDKGFYYGYICKNDGKIFKDVEQVLISNFMSKLPNLLEEVVGNNCFRLTYDYDKELYQSAIVHHIGFVNEKEQYIVDSKKNTSSTSLEESVLKLENLLDKVNKKEKMKIKII